MTLSAALGSRLAMLAVSLGPAHGFFGGLKVPLSARRAREVTKRNEIQFG